MIVVCCDCKRKLGEKPPFDDKSETHTYCPTCLKKVMDELDELERRKARKNPQLRRSRRVVTLPEHRHVNPGGNPASRAHVIGEIPGRIEEIRYRRFGPQVSRQMRGPYRHIFKTPGTKMLALSDGSVLIRNSRKKLWLRNDAD